LKYVSFGAAPVDLGAFVDPKALDSDLTGIEWPI
jgi:hypothetical protein